MQVCHRGFQDCNVIFLNLFFVFPVLVEKKCAKDHMTQLPFKIGFPRFQLPWIGIFSKICRIKNCKKTLDSNVIVFRIYFDFHSAIISTPCIFKLTLNSQELNLEAGLIIDCIPNIGRYIEMVLLYLSIQPNYLQNWDSSAV